LAAFEIEASPFTVRLVQEGLVKPKGKTRIPSSSVRSVIREQPNASQIRDLDRTVEVLMWVSHFLGQTTCQNDIESPEVVLSNLTIAAGLKGAPKAEMGDIRAVWCLMVTLQSNVCHSTPIENVTRLYKDVRVVSDGN
jgi:hypothetical protein